MPAGLLATGSAARGGAGLLLSAELGWVGAVVTATNGTAGNWR